MCVYMCVVWYMYECMCTCMLCMCTCVVYVYICAMCVPAYTQSKCSCPITPHIHASMSQYGPYRNPQAPAGDQALAKPPAQPHSLETSTHGEVICSRQSVSLMEMPKEPWGGQPGVSPGQEISSDCFKISSAFTPKYQLHHGHMKIESTK